MCGHACSVLARGKERTDREAQRHAIEPALVAPARRRPEPGGRGRGRARAAGSAATKPSWARRSASSCGATRPAPARRAIDAVMAEMHRIDRPMSPYKPDSELSRINRDAGRAPVAGQRRDVRPARALAASSRACPTARSTSPTPASASLYDYRARHRARRRRARARARAPIGWQQPDARRRRPARCASRRDGMRIDLGGFAKGHAVDNASRSCSGRGIRHAIVSAGGDSRVIGDRRGRPWTIGDPRPAPRRRRGRGAAARGHRRSRPRATTSATSSATACAITT